MAWATIARASATVVGTLAASAYCAWIASKDVLERKVREGQDLQRQQPGALRQPVDRIIFLLWADGQHGSRKLSRAEAGKALLGGFSEAALPLLEELVVYVDDPANHGIAVTKSSQPLAPPMCGAVLARSSEDRTAQRLGDVLARLGFRYHYYQTQSHVYTDYGEYAGPCQKGWDPRRGRDWPLGERSPYIGALTCFPATAGYVSRESWVDQWWSAQSPMSEMIQPRPRYVRNAVMPTGRTDGAPDFGGIVVEMWPSVWHMLNPFLFFYARGPWELMVHIAVMLRSVTAIMDFSRIQQVTVSEYILK